MRVRSLDIGRWRNLEGVTIELAPDADYLCLVGENGTGKSSILELLSVAANHLGIAPGVALKRPNPRDRQEPHAVKVVIDVGDLVDTDVVAPLLAQQPGSVRESLSSWDGSLIYEAIGIRHPPDQPPTPPLPFASSSSSSPGYTWWASIRAGGLAQDSEQAQLGGVIVSVLQRRLEVLHLYVDAERVFPPPAIRDDEVLAAAREDTTAPGWARAQAVALSQNLYLQWLRQMLGEQQRLQSDYFQQAREAAAGGHAVPAPPDPLASYAAGINDVLPHLRFVRLDQARHALIFEAGGVELDYEDLSGGEREVAFLVGQVERFGMRSGLFLVDEPELHLNAELLRTWLAYLRQSVESGQGGCCMSR